jgi:hypothetical protein
MPAKKKGIQWDGTIGPASIVGVIGSLSVLVSVGVMWGTMATKQESIQSTVLGLERTARNRDEHVSAQGERLGKVETSVSYISSAISRIESAVAK